MIDFDGPTTTITLETGVTSVDALDIYSRWKDWVILSDNAKYNQAFRVIGGDPLGGGINAGSYFFLQNQFGWRIKPPEENIQIVIGGNIFAEDTGSPVFIPTTGNFNTTINLQTSSLTQVVEVNTGSGVTPQDIIDIADAVWDEDATTHSITDSTGEILQNISAGDLTQIEATLEFVRKLLANKVQISGDNSVTTIFDDDKVTPVHIFDHADERNRDPR